MPCYVTKQEVMQKWKAERQLDLERKQAKASSEKLQRKLEALELLQEKYAQVSATAHICIGSAYDTPLENGTENSEVHCLLL